MKLFNCGNVKCTKDNQFCIEVDGIRILYTVSFTPGMLQEFVLKSTNYNSICKIAFDVRKGKVIHVETIGFKADKVKTALEECFKEEGILYTANRR